MSWWLLCISPVYFAFVNWNYCLRMSCPFFLFIFVHYVFQYLFIFISIRLRDILIVFYFEVTIDLPARTNTQRKRENPCPFAQLSQLGVFWLTKQCNIAIKKLTFDGIHQPPVDFTCTYLCVQLILCSFVTRVDLCAVTQSDTKQVCHKDPFCPFIDVTTPLPTFLLPGSPRSRVVCKWNHAWCSLLRLTPPPLYSA